MARPQDYRKEYDEKIVQLAKEGLFLEEIAVSFGVCARTLRNWTRYNPEFSRSYDIARDILIANLKKGMINASQTRGTNPRGYEFLIEQMTRQSRYAPVKIEGISKGSFNDKVDRVIDALEHEELRADEAQAIMNVLKTAQEIKEARKALDKLEEIEEKK